MMYEPLLLNFGNPEILINSPLLLRADGPITTLISTPVQWFMAWRIKVITRSKVLTAFIWGLSLASLAGGILTSVALVSTPEFQRFGEFKYAPSLWQVTSAVADITISSSLVYSLLKQKTRLSTTNDQVDRIIWLTVQTGTITAVAALADAVVYLSVTIIPTPFSARYDYCFCSLNARKIGGRPGAGVTTTGPGNLSVLFASYESEDSARYPNSRSLNDIEMAERSKSNGPLDSFDLDLDYHDESPSPSFIRPPPPVRVAYSVSSISRTD
ncbi:hypothetical protein Moror_11998 [Moniliophthora roreri MCA 2997]|uniref:DUF6534 domain-containing protein n=1 Tax=Moniliophthora roreri (strain MCA 2997) TaxID=1381753 RepID=V2X3G7_MONRO|nr:hypothetical protein Moror_11998 [Moniliophthora roreri MCA 2997]